MDQAAVRLAQDVAAGKCQPSAEEFRRRLYTVGLPPVDYLIRTSGELRVSNFLLYQAAYAELYFIDVYWPDFNGTICPGAAGVCRAQSQIWRS